MINPDHEYVITEVIKNGSFSEYVSQSSVSLQESLRIELHSNRRNTNRKSMIQPCLAGMAGRRCKSPKEIKQYSICPSCSFEIFWSQVILFVNREKNLFTKDTMHSQSCMQNLNLKIWIQNMSRPNIFHRNSDIIVWGLQCVFGDRTMEKN